ncbi:MAG: zinc carboxypeptidase, partial [Flavobacteriaceae bacterium]
SKSKAIVFGQTKDPVSAYKLAEILERHKIIIHQLDKPFTYKGKTYRPEGSYVVPLEQKKNKLIRGMFEKRTQFEDSLFYDISGWTFPLAFNLQYDFVNNTSMAGSQIEKLTTPEGSITATSNYAYLFEAHGYETPAALYELMKAGIRIKTALKPFASDAAKFDYGTYMIPVQNQSLSGEALTQKLAEVAQKYSLKVTGVNTGLMEGIDLGSRLFVTLELPKIAMLVGDGVRSYDAGEIWHLFDTRYNIPLTKIDIRDLSRVDLSDYTHFILPSYSGEWLDYFADKLKEYTKEGGTLIGYRYSVEWLKKHDFIDLDFKSFDPIASGVSFDQKSDWEGAQNIGGAVFNTRIDRSHPINFGVVGNSLPMFRNTSIFIKPNINSYNNPIQYTNYPLLSGYISEEKLELLRNSVPFQTQEKGEGRVIIFTDNTNFRAFWYGTNRLLANAIFLSKAM